MLGGVGGSPTLPTVAARDGKKRWEYRARGARCGAAAPPNEGTWMHSPAGIEPWDAVAMTTDLLELVRGLPRERLDRIEAPNVPGAYLQFLAAPWLASTMGTLAQGRYPVYAGLAARSLRERIGRYRLTLRGVRAFSERDVYVLVVPCGSPASAAFAEAALIEALDPIWNGNGYGAKTPGAKRSGQRASEFDALFPGRHWRPAASLIDEACARLAVVSRLACLGAGESRWPPIEPI